MVSKNDLREALTAELESRNVEDADEIADSVVEKLDENGAFESLSDDE